MIIDAIAIAVLIVSAIISFLRGFIREVLTILGVVGGVAAAWAGGPILSPIIKNWLGVKEGVPPDRLFGLIPYSILGDILSYGAVFLGVVIVLSLISHALAESARALGLGAVDRTLGVLFGLARGALLLAIVFIPVHLGLDDKTKEEWFSGSRTTVYLDGGAAQLVALLPESAVKDAKEKAQQTANDPSVREQLINSGLLAGQKPEEKAGEKNPAPAPDKNGSNGYGDEFREEMNKMFEQQSPPQQ
jgi:membrane protein required for colicin V production